LFDRADALDPNNDGALCALVTLVHQGRCQEALERARRQRKLRLSLAQLASDHAPEILADALSLLDEDLIEQSTPDVAYELLQAAIAHAPAWIAHFLAILPRRPEYIPYVYNASFKGGEAERLKLLEWVIAFPAEMIDRNTTAWQGYLMAWNNACISAHALRDYALACSIADAADEYAAFNPYILHSAACAYAALGAYDRALGCIERAAKLEYDHFDKIETDPDLGELLEHPKLKQIFEERRLRFATSEGIVEVDTLTFERDVLAFDKPVLVELVASWCGPCRTLAPHIERLAREAGGRYRVARIDIDESPTLAERLKVTGVPTVVVVVNGFPRARHVGLTDVRTLRTMLLSSQS
jgi:thiol-disulfide isomerase/thioredoxin